MASAAEGEVCARRSGSEDKVRVLVGRSCVRREVILGS